MGYTFSLRKQTYFRSLLTSTRVERCDDRKYEANGSEEIAFLSFALPQESYSTKFYKVPVNLVPRSPTATFQCKTEWDLGTRLGPGVQPPKLLTNLLNNTMSLFYTLGMRLMNENTAEHNKLRIKPYGASVQNSLKSLNNRFPHTWILQLVISLPYYIPEPRNRNQFWAELPRV